MLTILLYLLYKRPVPESNTCILNKNTGRSDYKLTTVLITAVSIILLLIYLMAYHLYLNKGLYDAI